MSFANFSNPKVKKMRREGTETPEFLFKRTHLFANEFSTEEQKLNTWT